MTKPFVGIETSAGFVISSNDTGIVTPRIVAFVPDTFTNSQKTTYEQGLLDSLNLAYDNSSTFVAEMKNYVSLNQGIESTFLDSSSTAIVQSQTLNQVSGGFAANTYWDNSGPTYQRVLTQSSNPTDPYAVHVLINAGDSSTFPLSQSSNVDDVNVNLRLFAQEIAHEIDHPLVGPHIWDANGRFNQPSSVIEVLDDPVSDAGIHTDSSFA